MLAAEQKISGHNALLWGPLIFSLAMIVCSKNYWYCAILLLMIGICCLPVALIAVLTTINTFKKHLSSELESEAVKFKVCQLW